MDLILNDTETRTLGVLIEKELTTPDYYPMSLNAVTNACNQKNNRDPVVAYDEETVEEALRGLREKGLAIKMAGDVGRVPKHRHRFTEVLKLTRHQVAALCVMMLRGPQTVGEIRGRTERMTDFRDLAEVEQTLEALARREAGALAIKLPRQPGRKESRYAHLLSGVPEVTAEEAPTPVAAPQSPEQHPMEESRLTQLEEEVRALRDEVENLKQQVVELRTRVESS